MLIPTGPILSTGPLRIALSFPILLPTIIGRDGVGGNDAGVKD